MFTVAFKGTEGGYEISNFSDKIFNKGIWGLDCLYSDYACGVFLEHSYYGNINSIFHQLFLGLAFCIIGLQEPVLDLKK
jgi:hypothetical protein